MTRQPRLSICIPTYNFGAFIVETVESIAPQLTPEVDIVILDSASTDNTREIVAQLATRVPNLTYVRADAKRGIDRDMARVVELASGEFIWLFSADDRMRPDSLARVLGVLKDGVDVWLCSHTNCDLAMRVLGNHRVIKAKAGATYDLADERQRLDYVARAESSEAFFSFMSGIIVRRASWNKVSLNEKFVGSCWAHAARMFDLLSGPGLVVQYIDGPLLDKRGDNDSFASDGLVRRFQIAIRGYTDLAEHYFGADSREAFHIRRVLRGEYPLMSMLSINRVARLSGDTADIGIVADLVRRLYADQSPGNLLRRYAIFIYALMPLGLETAARRTLAWPVLRRLLRTMDTVR